jgi:hypothetical protein
MLIQELVAGDIACRCQDSQVVSYSSRDQIDNWSINTDSAPDLMLLFCRTDTTEQKASKSS